MANESKTFVLTLNERKQVFSHLPKVVRPKLKEGIGQSRIISVFSAQNAISTDYKLIETVWHDMTFDYDWIEFGVSFLLPTKKDLPGKSKCKM